MKTIIFSFALLWSFQAQAQGATCSTLTGNKVFFDFNNSKNEVAAVQTEATNQCQNFHHIKSMDQARTLFNRLERERSSIDDLIFSGHSGQQNFYGDNFAINRDELGRFMGSFPHLKKNISDLHLWGCYTNNVDKLNKWRAAIPGMNRVFGFKHRSPLDHQMLGAEYLGNAIKYKHELDKASSLDEIKSIIEGKISTGNMLASAIWGNCKIDGKDRQYYFNTENTDRGWAGKIFDFTDYDKMCPPAVKTFGSKYKQILGDYWHGRKPLLLTSDPVSKDPRQYPLRMDLYPWASDHAHCFPEGFPVGPKEWMHVGQAQNLIYFDHIKKNYFDYLDKDLKGRVALASQLPLSKASKALLAKREKMTRADVVKVNKELQQLVRQKRLSGGAYTYAHTFKKFLYEMDDQCTGLEWLDYPTRSISPPSSCLGR